MRKFLTALGLAALLSLSLAGTANAVVVTSTESGALFNAVGEVSTSMTVAGSTQLSIFITGTYAAGNTLVLQEELGSPGSGAFRTVLTLTTATANAHIVTGFTTGPNRNAYRLLMTATGTGDIVATMTDRSRTATALATYRNDFANQVFTFDDFHNTDREASTTVIDDERYVSQTSNDNAGTVAANTPAVMEGGVTIVSGSGVSDAATCFSPITTANFAALVSDGWTVLEVRIQADNVTGTTGMHIVDIPCAADNVAPVTMTTGTFVQTDGLSENIAGIAMFPDATASTEFQAYSALADAQGADDKEVPIGVFAASAYRVLRVEIDKLGNGYFFVDGQLEHVEALAVETTEELIWNVWNDDTDSSAITSVIDYVVFITPRPADASS